MWFLTKKSFVKYNVLKTLVDDILLYFLPEQFHNNPLNTLKKFLVYVLANKLKHLPEKKTAYITITAKELLDYDVQTGDTEGLVNYALSIEGVKFAALMVDRTVLVKLSFRSKGKIPANEFAVSVI